nr:hypothetical protein [Tanacetum cinerariifolium]
MSNTNNTMQTQTSNTLHNASMEADGKDRPIMLAPGNYVQWKSRIKRYIDTKPNHELIHYCLKNPPYKYALADKVVLISEGSSETTTERYMENYKNVSQDIRDQLNAEAEAVQIILTGIDNDIYYTVDAYPNACEMWKAVESESLESYYSRFYKMMNELVRNQCDVTNHQVNVQFLLQLQPEWQRAHQDNSPRINRGTGYDNQRIGNVAGDRDNVGIGSNYMYMAQIQEVTPDAADNSGPIFDTEPLQQVPTNDNYNMFAIESEHPEQSKSIHDTYLIEQDEHNVIIDSLDMSYDREQIDQNDDDDALVNERDLLASLIEKQKCEIDDSKNRNKILETSNKVLVDKLKGMKKELPVHQETISILSQQKEAQIKLYKTREDKELDKVIALENKVKVLNNIVYKTGQSVQTMNMLNHNCKTSFAKPEFLKKAQRENPRLYDI